MLPQVGLSPSPAPLQGRCWVGSGRTDVQSAPSLQVPKSWRERRHPGRVQGIFCLEIKGLALPKQQLSLRARRGHAAASGRFQTFGPRQHQHLPPEQETAAAPGEGCGSGEPSQAAKGTFPSRPPSCWVRASCSCSVALHNTGAFVSQLILQNVTFSSRFLCCWEVFLCLWQNVQCTRARGALGQQRMAQAARDRDMSTFTSSWHWLNGAQSLLERFPSFCSDVF